jgi:DNA-binding transcriptional ArsR family regulator
VLSAIDRGIPRREVAELFEVSLPTIERWLERRCQTGGDAPIINHMVERSGQLDAVFHALAHDARRDMLRRLADRELTVGELAEPLEMSLPAASKHLQVLEGAGLVRRTVMGRRHVCRLDPGPLAGADEWLRFYERYWNEQLDALERIFDDDTKGDR